MSGGRSNGCLNRSNMRAAAKAAISLDEISLLKNRFDPGNFAFGRGYVGSRKRRPLISDPRHPPIGHARRAVPIDLDSHVVNRSTARYATHFSHDGSANGFLRFRCFFHF